MGKVRVENRGCLLQTLLIKMILTFNLLAKFFFHFNILLYFVWVFLFFLRSLITEFQINIFRGRQNNQGQETLREHRRIIKRAPSGPLGNPPLGHLRGRRPRPLDARPGGAHKPGRDRAGHQGLQIGTCPCALTEGQPLGGKSVSFQESGPPDQPADLCPRPSLACGEVTRRHQAGQGERGKSCFVTRFARSLPAS